jgi:hypothetical protein
LQLEAARIVTGLPIFASSVLIYKELGWESLVERRKRRTLQMFYNTGIQNNNTPRYLCALIPPTIQSTAVYLLRNHRGKADDRNCNYGHPKMADVESGKNLFCRLNSFYNVF